MIMMFQPCVIKQRELEFSSGELRAGHLKLTMLAMFLESPT